MANKQRGTKLLLADLIAKKLEKENKRASAEDVYVESLGGLITVRVPEERIILKTIDMMKDETIAGVLEAYEYVIYHSVDHFQNPELHEGLHVPTDIVAKLLEVSERLELGNKIMEMSGFNDVDKKVKK